MSWYNKAQTNQSLLFSPEEWNKTEGHVPKQPEYFEISDSLSDDLEYAKSKEEIERIAEAHGFDSWIVEFPEATSVLVLQKNSETYVVYDLDDGSQIVEAQQWIDDIGDLYLDEYVQNPNTDFWEDVAPGYYVYHGTDKNNVENIQRHGLEPRADTRGIANKWTPDGVFTYPNYEVASYHYDEVFEIDVGAMKADGYMPNASGEEPIEESEMRKAIANKIGYDDYYAPEDNSTEYDPGTVIFFAVVPPKYLRLMD